MRGIDCTMADAGWLPRGIRALLLFVAWLYGNAAVAADASYGLTLYAGDGQVSGYAPELQADAAIDVTGMVARVRVTQRFRNPHDAWVEGIYTFPLPQDAAVDRLRLRYGGRLIEGEIQERGQAQQTYRQARESGQGASLLDQQRANVFTTSVANIPPGETVQVEIAYQQAVEWRDPVFSLRFPMVLGPRYIPGEPLPDGSGGSDRAGWAQDTGQVPDAAQITPPVVVGDAGGMNPVDIAVQLDVGLPLGLISSPYHAIDVSEQSPGRYRVTLAAGPVPAHRDFALHWRPALGAEPGAALFTEVWQGRHYSLLQLMPPQAQALPEPVARELVLVVDTSGSMHGDSIRQARAALLHALAQLRPADRFNLIQFNSSVEALFDRAVPADTDHIARARRYVRGLQADGGTEMLPAMQRALRDPDPSGLLRQVVFLTDGAIGNEQALFGQIARDIGASRLFTVGIGSAPNALFMTRAAEHGRGTFTYIGAADEVEDRVGALFGQLSAPVLTDVQLEWLGAGGPQPVIQAPLAVPDLYAGEPLLVAVESPQPPSAVRIRARLAGRDWNFRAVLQGAPASGGVHTLWARRMIADWMGRLVIGEDPARVREAVLALAMRHHLVSRYTSLVAVDRTPRRPPASALESAAVPTLLPAGWSAQAVFGRLPGTATAAPLLMLIGGAGLLLGWLGRRRRV